MENKQTYKLTKHPIGSFLELFTLSAPLMIGFFSMNLIFIVERLIMASISTEKMNVLAQGGMLFWSCIVFFWIFADTVEILVGRYNGAGELHKVAAPVWQAIWVILAVTPLYAVLLYCIVPYFATGDNAADVVLFFRTLIYFCPFYILPIAIQTFFIGTGRTNFATVMMIITNLLNLVLTLFAIYILKWDIFGVGCAAGITNVIATGVWLALFLSKKNRALYATSFQKFHFPVFKELILLAGPSAMAKTIECFAHAAFYSILAYVSTRALTMAVIGQTILIFISFIVEGTSKGAGAIISNLVGAKRFDLIPKVLRTGFLFHTACVALLSVLLFACKKPLVMLFTGSSAAYLTDPLFIPELMLMFVALLFFFLIDGYAWILFNLLAAINDTNFVFYVNAVLNIVGYVLPVYIFVGIYHYGSVAAWTIVAICNLLIFITYQLRYKAKLQEVTVTPQAV